MKIVRKGSKRWKWEPVVWALILILLAIVIYFLEGGNRTNFSWHGIPASLGIENSGKELSTLVVDMAFVDYDKILDQRNEALTSGVFIANEQDFVPANITFQGEEVPVRLRLMQGSHNHLGENDKWDFDGRTRNNDLLKGMERFYLFDPADNNWHNAMAFAAALEREGILANRIEFVRLFFNGEDKGIYTLVEGFGQDLMTTNGRKEGVLVEYDVTPIWQTMAAYGASDIELLNNPISDFSLLDPGLYEVDTFRDNQIAADADLTRQKNIAINALRRFQSGELRASEVFDLEKYGRFLALSDLWGAVQGLSLTNLRYYYNPDTGLLEPVGFNSNPLGSTQRIPFGATLFDSQLQAAYVQAAHDFSQPEYLERMENELADDLANYQALSGLEVDIPEPWEELKDRQEQIRNSLQPVQPIIANLGPQSLASDGIVQIDIANVLNIPIEIIGFDIDGATFMEVDADWIAGGQNNYNIGQNDEIILPGLDAGQLPTLRFLRFQIPLEKIHELDDELDFLQDPQFSVAVRIQGLDESQMIPAKPGFSE